jgi:hypothetical protein
MEKENDSTVADAPKKPEVRLVDIPVTDEVGALNLLVSFLNLAQRRGVFTIDESAKIWDCVKMFQKK